MLQMRVKRNPNEPYRRVFEAVFDVEAEPETRFSYLLTNCSKPHGEAEAHIEGLIDKFDATNGESTRTSGASPLRDY